MNLYSWQEECLKKWFSNHGRGIVQAVTGAGKTILALTAADRLKKQLDCRLHIMIVVPTASLMRQWEQALRTFFKDSSEDIRQKISLRGGGYKTCADRPYTIYVINSARYELARRILTDLKKGDAVLLIADECHHYASGQNSLIFEFLPYIKDYPGRYFSLGLSATLPANQTKHTLTSALGKEIYHYGMRQAAAQHNICPYDVFHIALSFTPEEQNAYQDISERITLLYRRLLQHSPQLKNMTQSEQFELLRILSSSHNSSVAQTAVQYMTLSYKRKSLVCTASTRTLCACDLVFLLPSNEKILIFGERVSQAEDLYSLLTSKYPGKVGRYHSNLDRHLNRRTLQRFRDGELRILITCKSLDEGLDVPDASIGIILSGTSMQRQRIQRLGRIIRKKEGKSRASLYYLHVTDTAEEGVFLPDTSACHVLELEYDPGTHLFSSSRYARASALLLEYLVKNGIHAALSNEFMRCIRLGSVRSDWLEPHDIITQKINTASSTAEKNYWICMKKVQESANKLISGEGS